ncbi:MAG: metal ABC transporter ATP-binding protein [Selenomonadaceae bacterium]|nr:metal ABC transporter ATP-binding protein [Selenomonadaceae bacterium]
MIKKILHHVKNEGCGDFCCTKIENFSVKSGELTVFEGVNLHVHCGELTAIIGANGAGKSTFLRAVLGEVPHGGTLTFVGANGEMAKKPVIGYVPQELRFDRTAPISVYDLFAAALGVFPVWLPTRKSMLKKVEAALSRVKAEYLIERRLGALSGGELQRVMLALSLNPLPNLLLLDEPISGVDYEGRALFLEIVSNLREKEDMAIILVSHDLDLVKKYADRVVVMEHGIKAAGNPEEVFDNIRGVDFSQGRPDSGYSI